jgi:hypothetical protein
MECYLYNIELPLSGIKFFYRELTSKEQILLSKANIMLPYGETDTNKDYGTFLFDVMSNCLKNKEDLKKINLIDYIILAIQIRIISVGPTMEIAFKKEDSIGIKMELNLQSFIKNLFYAVQNVLPSENIEEDEFSVKLDWPQISDEGLFLDKVEPSTFALQLSESIPSYIKRLIINQKEIDFHSYSFEEKTKLYDLLPLKLQNKILSVITSSIEKFNTFNLFNISQPEYARFNIYSGVYQSYIRLFFSENLQNIYQEYYILASKNITPIYVDGLTIAERKVYYSFVEQELEQQSSNNSENQREYDPLSELASEYGEEYPN